MIYVVYTANTSKKKLPVYGVKRDDDSLSISFDCAWGVEYTDGILDALDFYGVKATFFVVQFWAEKYPDYLKKISERGHEIGTHSKTHPKMSKLSEKAIEEELTSSVKAIEEITGKKVTLFRPPFGDYNDRLITVAEKLGLTQVTYAEEILNVDKAAKKITVKRHIDGGVETVEAPLPIVITVNGSAAPCRPRNAKLVQKYKRALGAQEKAAITKEGAELAYADLYEKYPYLNITEWSVADVNGDLAQCGLSGSPTKVKTIQNISFQAKESKTLTGSNKDVEDLIVELLANHTIG